MANPNAGRKSKLTPQLQARFINALRLGLTIERACELVNVDSATYFRWIARGKRETSGVFREFCEALSAAEAECELVLVEKISQSADWRSGAWILERRFPAQWGDRVRELQQQVTQKNKQIDVFMRVLARILNEPTEGQDAVRLKNHCVTAIDELRLAAGLPVEDIQRLLADIQLEGK